MFRLMNPIGLKSQNSVFIITAVFLVILILLSACDDFSFYSQLDGAENLRINTPGLNSDDTLSIIPEKAVIPVLTSYTFSAEGGVPPYLFSVVSGAGTINSSTGVFSADSTPGEVVIAVSDDSGAVAEADLTTVSVGEFTISPVALSIYINNTATFSTFGGTAPYSYTIVSGNGTVNADSGLYKAPSTPGNDIVRATDSNGNTSDATITVFEPLSLTPSGITLSVDNTYSFTASGGSEPYNFTLSDDGTGSEIGTVTDAGLFTAPASSGTNLLTVTDKLGNSFSSRITIIPPAALLISPSDVTVNTGGTRTFSATGGTPPYTFSIISLISDGTVDSSGNYTASDTAGTEYVKLTDSLGGVSTAEVTVVSTGALTISPLDSSVAQNGGKLDFSADGGTPPYMFSIISGDGLINSSTGLFTAPAGLGVCTIRVTDAVNSFAETDVTVKPAAPTSLVADGGTGNPQSVNLSWIDNSDGEDGFIIERKISSGSYAEIVRVGADVVIYTDDDSLDPLNPTSLYGYRVRAYSGVIESDNSNESFAVPNS